MCDHSSGLPLLSIVSFRIYEKQDEENQELNHSSKSKYSVFLTRRPGCVFTVDFYRLRHIAQEIGPMLIVIIFRPIVPQIKACSQTKVYNTLNTYISL